MQRTLLFLAGLLFVSSVAGVVQSTVSAQDKTTAAGVYTEAQAKRGGQVYTDTCAMCHGADLKGSDTVPGLAGMEFEGFWRDQPLVDLFERISVTMPKSAPGSLKPEQTADVIAYLLSEMKEPAGQTDLSAKPDDLKTIKIQAKQ